MLFLNKRPLLWITYSFAMDASLNRETEQTQSLSPIEKTYLKAL